MQMNYEWLWKRFYVIVVKTGSSMKRLWLQLQLRSLWNGYTLILLLTHQSSFRPLVLNFLIHSLAYPCDENLSTSAVTANAFNDLIFGEASQSSWLVFFWWIFIRLFIVNIIFTAKVLSKFWIRWVITISATTSSGFYFYGGREWKILFLRANISLQLIAFIFLNSWRGLPFTHKLYSHLFGETTDAD